MSNQLNIVLLLFGGLQGFLLSVILIKKKAQQVGYGFLISYLLVMIAQVLFKVAGKLWLMSNLHFYYSLSFQLPFLYGPLVYLFTRSILTRQKAHRIHDLLHFLPFLISAILLFLSGYYSLPRWMYFLFFGTTGTLMQLLSLLIYHYLALGEWERHYGRMKAHFSNIGQLRMKWLKNFVIVSAIVCMAITMLLYFMYQYFPGLQFLRWGFILLSIFIYWISYVAINKPVLFSAAEHDDLERKNVPVVAIQSKLVVHKRAEKYANTGLKEEEASRILLNLEKLMQQEKAFLDPEITIDKLAALVDTNRHFLSQVLNERAGQSFYDYINQHRVSEAKRLLKDPAYSNQKIASIAYDAGFNSLSAFNEVFKKLAGTTPSRFKKEEQQVSRQQRG